MSRLLFDRITELARKHGGLRRAAASLGMNPGFLCQVRSGKKIPSNKTLTKLGIRRLINYEAENEAQ